MQIPQYLNPNSLTIQKASRKETEDGSIQTLQAADPEGDQVNLRKWTEDTGATTMMPDTEFTVSYQKAGTEPEPFHKISGDEAYDLSWGLQDAARQTEPNDEIDIFAMNFLIADLRSKGGGGGAA